MKNAMQLKAIMKKLAKENQISAQLVLQNYMLERFLERVSLSPYRDNYIIKGGFLISSMVGLNSRATMDMDATIKGYPVTQDAVQKMIEQILTVPVDDDITFTFKSIQNDSLQSLLLGEKMRTFIKDGWNVPAECQQCRWVNLCHGGCKRDRNTADEAQRSYYCKALQKFFAYAEPRMREMARAVQMYR